jgi:hypothetical protein
MEFLSNLHMEIKLLLVASALALFAALVSGNKKKEHRYMALFAVLMVVAGVRLKHEDEQEVATDRLAADVAVSHAKSVARPVAR